MVLDEWAEKWSISRLAIEDLKRRMGTSKALGFAGLSKASEHAVLNRVRLEATEKGLRLWRNNLGAAYLQDGTFLRYGLANESSAINKRIKSADLIGIKPVKITPKMVGYTFGQFVSREIKAPSWRFSGTEREQAQLKWAELILSMGGDACFANQEGTL